MQATNVDWTPLEAQFLSGRGFSSPLRATIVRFFSGVLVFVCLAGCDKSPPPVAKKKSPKTLSAASAAKPPASVNSQPAPKTSAPPPAATCPTGMSLVPGGLFRMGTEGALDETPSHKVGVRSFCMDKHEFTVAHYQECERAGVCKPSHKGHRGCSEYRPNTADHPINCVDWYQANQACERLGKRLPAEREWEYVARGGKEQRYFPWGDKPPGGRSCYNHAGTCKVGSYPPTAFGLFDVGGNVWEWTASVFGPYPEEAESGPLRVYRGGSYSRRFPRWMRSALRNRYRPKRHGAHLGFRCAKSLGGAQCPSGYHDEGDIACRRKGAPPKKPKAAPGKNPGAARGKGPGNSGKNDGVVEPPPMVISRSPGFDEDCRKYKPGRPIAYRFGGGTFASRQRAGKSRGCINRDVGIGWNSSCCPN